MQDGQADKQASFVKLACELGCDPDDPRVADVLKAMAKQPPKPHGKDAGDNDRTKKTEKG